MWITRVFRVWRGGSASACGGCAAGGDVDNRWITGGRRGSAGGRPGCAACAALWGEGGRPWGDFPGAQSCAACS